MSTRVHKVFSLLIFFFFLKTDNSFNIRTELFTRPATNKKPSISIYILPPRKKSIIFLRAPYKNKLARLNILRLEHSVIFSLKTHSLTTQPLTYILLNQKELIFMLSQLVNYNLSLSRFKHSRTKLSLNVYKTTNFLFNYHLNFN